MGLLGRAVNNTAEPFSGKLAGSITKFGSIHSNFNCILIEIPQNTDSDADFCKKVNVMVDKLGTVSALPNGRPLVMLPMSRDRELIAHRLSKTLNAKILLSFQADSSEIAINKINAFSNAQME